MRGMDEENEEKGPEEELVSTEHRDAEEPIVLPEDEPDVFISGPTPRSGLDVLGEDVSSSAARRDHEDLENPDEPLDDGLGERRSDGMGGA